jgi:hypothetical protein
MAVMEIRKVRRVESSSAAEGMTAYIRTTMEAQGGSAKVYSWHVAGCT